LRKSGDTPPNSLPSGLDFSTDPKGQELSRILHFQQRRQTVLVAVVMTMRDQGRPTPTLVCPGIGCLSPLARRAAMFAPSLLWLACCALLGAGEAPADAKSGEKPQPPKDAVDPEVLGKVRKLASDTLSTDNAVREAAWNGLKNMGNLAVPGLVALCRQPETAPEMLRSIVIALGDTKDPRAGPVLMELLAAKDARLRRDAARSLGDSGCRQAVPALEKLAGNAAEEEDVRLFAAVAGSRLGSTEAARVLGELAQSPRAETRSRAVFALGKCGGLKELAVLAKALADSDRDVREDAVLALRQVKRKEAWGALVLAAADSDYKVRNAAMEALRELTGQQLGNDPAAWKAWWAKTEGRPAPAKE